MNREQNEKFRDRSLRGKYNMMHRLPELGLSALSAAYLKSFYNSSKKFQVNLPQLIAAPDSKFCGKCGLIRIPRHTTDIKLDSNTDFKVTCRQCCHPSRFKLIKKRITDPETPREPFVAKWPKEQIKNTNQQHDAVTKKTNGAKDRRKKRQMNSLNSILNKKSQDKQKKLSSTLSLDSFMKL